MSTLEVQNMRFAYGLVEVLHGVSFAVDEGEILALIGPNGAGKSTLLNVISGAFSPTHGEVRLDGEDVTGRSQARLVKQGVILVPEGRQVFDALSVEDNLDLGAFSRRRESDFASERQRVFELFPRLEDRRAQKAGTLSGGEQQMLAIGRALMARPRLMLLDEPSLGLAPQLVTLIMDTIRQLRDDGITVLLVEQNARAALKLADRACLLDTGEIRAQGTAAELAQDERVLSVYLGGSGEQRGAAQT
jgi:branched-chain amino acid transport system ATP-binding protein